ncbi:hypothetical protein K439DRAFT_1650083 [Ramaria rubella]|nr:hypothetical protein K439DRAFT_1650083 [Ramaria rubella]
MSPSLSEEFTAIVLASRPPGWCFGLILFGIGFIHSRSSTPKTMAPLCVAATYVFSLSFPLCTIIFGINDVYDYDSDIKNPRKIASGLEGGILSPVYHSSVRRAAYFSTVLIILTSLFTLRYQNAVATSLLEIPIVDSFSNGMIVFLAWLTGCSFGHGRFSDAPEKGVILSMCTAGIHALGAVVDVNSDIAAKQKTIATFFGQRFAVLVGVLTFVAALLVERDHSGVFVIYLWGGAVIMLAPCLHIRWAHYAFQIIVYWTVGMAILWLGSKALRRRHNVPTTS